MLGKMEVIRKLQSWFKSLKDEAFSWWPEFAKQENILLLRVSLDQYMDGRVTKTSRHRFPMSFVDLLDPSTRRIVKSISRFQQKDRIKEASRRKRQKWKRLCSRRLRREDWN